MKKYILLLTFILFFSATETQSADEVNIHRVTSVGEGCPPGSIEENGTLSQNNISLLFVDYIANSRFSEGQGDRVDARCDINISLTVPPGIKVAVRNVEFNGDTIVHPGGKTRFRARYWFAGNDLNIRREETWGCAGNNPCRLIDEEFLLKNEPDLIYTDCGEDAILKVTTTITAFKGSASQHSLIRMRGANARFDFKAAIVTKPCSGGGGNEGNEGNEGNGVILDADFNNGKNGFTFKRVRTTQEMARAYSDRDALQIYLGGKNDNKVYNMEGYWTRNFTMTSSRAATISVDAKLTQSSEYESEEKSTISLFIDGQKYLISTLTGNGNGGDKKTRSKRFSKTVNLRQGSHSIKLGCYNNRKTAENETTQCRFDNLIIQ